MSIEVELVTSYWAAAEERDWDGFGGGVRRNGGRYLT
jgi:hypothetical protein